MNLNSTPKNSFYITFERAAGTFINTTDYHDCCEFLTNSAGQQNFTQVTTSDSLEVVSTSANDSAAGTGTRTVGIIYLNALGEWSQTIVTLNGTTPVPLTGIQMSAVNSQYALTGGSSPVSAGTISLRNVNTPSIIYEQIVAGGNQSQSGRFTCPRGYYALLEHLNISVQGQPIEFKLRTTRNQFDGSSSNDRYLFKMGAKIAAGDSIEFDLHDMRLDAGQTVKVSGIADATAGNPRIHGTLALYLIKI